jgi:hypothetical protein
MCERRSFCVRVCVRTLLCSVFGPLSLLLLVLLLWLLCGCRRVAVVVFAVVDDYVAVALSSTTL